MANLVYTPQVEPRGIDAIPAKEVWVATKGANVNVVVIDSGIDTKHPDLAHAYAGGTNVLEDASAGPEDDLGHGTHVAGTIAAADNGFGVVGVAPGVKLWSAKVLDRGGFGTDETLVAGIEWAIARKKEIGGIWVANMSVGATAGSPAEARAIQHALNEGIHLVAAAGNDGSEFLNFPAAYPGVIAVGAVDEKLAVADFSTYGSGLSIVAPGVDVASSVLRGKFTEAHVQLPQEVLEAHSITGSPLQSVNAPFVDCGYGRLGEFPPDLTGKIAVIQRGPLGAEGIPFRQKARNAKDAGAAGVIIYNDDDQRRSDFTQWTLLVADPPWPDYQFPLTVAMSNANGTKLLGKSANAITAAYRYREYGILSGTSMATPHVAGTVALLASLDPTANPAHIEWILQRTAKDVNLDGWDARTAYGMIDALAAAKLLAPEAFDLPAEPPPTSTRRRSAKP